MADIMTPEDINDRIDEIRRHADDPERVHMMVDTLYIDVLRAIADRRCEDVSCCAFVALAASGILIERWLK